MQKNVAGQKWEVFAFNKTNNDPVTGDAEQITANLRIDHGSANPVDDTYPTELEDGRYEFDISQAESNGDYLSLFPESSTDNVMVLAWPANLYTTGGDSGEGAFTGTLTIDDGSTGLEGAVVNARRGGVLIASGTTDASGEITNWVFGAFTYDLAARLNGYGPETDTIAVSADAWSKTISLTANTISAPPNASTTTGVMKAYDEEQVEEAGVKIHVQILAGSETDGIAYDSTVWTETSSALGVIQFAGIVHGAQYKIWRGDSKAQSQTFTAPSSGDSFDLPEVIGRG